MNKKIEEIKQMLNEREQEREQTINQGRTELHGANERLKELKKSQTDPENLEEYTANAQKIRDTEAYIEYLSKKLVKAEKGRLLISDKELHEIRATIIEEIRAKQNDEVPEMQRLLNELIALMETHAAEVKELEEIASEAGRLFNPIFAAPLNGMQSLEGVKPDKYGYWIAFVRAFIGNYDTAVKIKAEESHHNVWTK